MERKGRWPQCTLSLPVKKTEPNFEIGTLTQIQNQNVHVTAPNVEIKPTLVKFAEKGIVVEPAINLQAKDLPRNERIVVPEIKVALTINIQWNMTFRQVNFARIELFELLMILIDCWIFCSSVKFPQTNFLGANKILEK